MTMSDLTRTDRDAIASKAIETVQTKHFDPHFEKERWKSAVEQQRSRIVDAADTSDFETALSDLVRSYGTPDAGFFHERSRKKVPKGLAARFQYCQPNECAPTFTKSSDAGDVMISKLADGVGWLKVTKFPGTIGIDIAKEIDHGIEERRAGARRRQAVRWRGCGGLRFRRVMSLG